MPRHSVAAPPRGVSELDDYESEPYRRALRGFADDYEAAAKAVPSRRDEIREFALAAAEMGLKLKEAKQFFDDLSLYLGTNPWANGANDPRERYSGSVVLFAKGLSELHRTLGEFRDKVPERPSHRSQKTKRL